MADAAAFDLLLNNPDSVIPSSRERSESSFHAPDESQPAATTPSGDGGGAGISPYNDAACVVSYEDVGGAAWLSVANAVEESLPIRAAAFDVGAGGDATVEAELSVRFVQKKDELLDDHVTNWFGRPYAHVLVVSYADVEEYKERRVEVSSWAWEQREAERPHLVLLVSSVEEGGAREEGGLRRMGQMFGESTRTTADEEPLSPPAAAAAQAGAGAGGRMGGLRGLGGMKKIGMAGFNLKDAAKKGMAGGLGTMALQGMVGELDMQVHKET